MNNMTFLAFIAKWQKEVNPIRKRDFQQDVIALCHNQRDYVTKLANEHIEKESAGGPTNSTKLSA